MYHRDYILDMLRRAAEAIHKVVFLRKNRQLEEAMALLSQAMKQLLGLNSKLVHGLSAKDLLSLLSKTGEVDVGKTLALGDMLKAEAELLDEMEDQVGARQCRLKGVELLLTAKQDVGGEWMPQLMQLVEELLQPVVKSAKPLTLYTHLISYYDETGRYTKAEDELFYYIEDLRQAGNKQELAEALNRGIEMVERWGHMSEEDAAASGLTTEEIADTFKELKKMKQMYLGDFEIVRE
jgi:hypothetical protein